MKTSGMGTWVWRCCWGSPEQCLYLFLSWCTSGAGSFPHPHMWVGSLQPGRVLLSPQPVCASFVVLKAGDNPWGSAFLFIPVHESEVTTTLWHRAVPVQSHPAARRHHPGHASGKSYQGERGSGIYRVLVRQIWCKLNSPGQADQTFKQMQLFIPYLPSRAGCCTPFSVQGQGEAVHGLFPNRLLSARNSLSRTCVFPSAKGQRSAKAQPKGLCSELCQALTPSCAGRAWLCWSLDGCQSSCCCRNTIAVSRL